ncbi:hypothetical protein D3C81_1764130 [compost metagenome]
MHQQRCATGQPEPKQLRARAVISGTVAANDVVAARDDNTRSIRAGSGTVPLGEVGFHYSIKRGRLKVNAIDAVERGFIVRR